MIQIHTGEFSGNNRGMNCQNKNDYVVLGFIKVLKGRPNLPMHLSFFCLHFKNIFHITSNLNNMVFISC